jgi:hypothetical protein
MKKSLLSALCFLLASSLAYSQQVSFKLLGGPTWIQGDDYNKGVAGEMEFIRDTMSDVSGAFQKLKKGTNFQFEIITHWGRRIATGLGGGYYQLGHHDRVASQGIAEDVPFTTDSTFQPQLSVIPFYLNIYYKIRLTSRAGLDVFAGPLFQIVQFSFERQTTSTVNSFSEKETFRAAAPSLGFQAGISLSYKLISGIALITDILYRSATATNLTGNWSLFSTSATGTVNNSSAEYYYYYYDYSQGKNYPRVGFFDKNGPAGDGISGIRKAHIDLSGLTAMIGVKIDI